MRSLEQLPPDTILPQMQRRADELLAVIEQMKKSISRAPVGRIKMIRHGGNIHCYHVTDVNSPAGRYIPISESRLIQSLAQKNVDEKALRELEQQLLLIDRFVAKYNPCALRVLYKNLSANRKSLITPVQLSDEEYAARWLLEEYQGKGFDADAPELLTAKGERVRSKSEMIIADTLAHYGVPYKYERPLLLKAGCGKEKKSEAQNSAAFIRKSRKKVKGDCCCDHLDVEDFSIANRELGGAKRISVFPDFTCLNLRTRMEFLWEHLGRMDDAEYAKKTVSKLRTYGNNGFVLGLNLIATMECEENPLNRSDVERLVKNFLL